MTSLPEGTADEELEKEAEWIFRHGFTKATVSKQDGFTEDECSDWTRKEDTVVEKIKKALDKISQGKKLDVLSEQDIVAMLSNLTMQQLNELL